MDTSKPKPGRDALLRHVRPGDLRAALQLTTQAATEVIGIAEGVHQAVRGRLGLPAGTLPQRTGGLTGQIYQGIRGVTQFVGHGLDSALASLLPLVDDPAQHPVASPAREAVLAALNGVMGDRLQETGNPLAQPMELRYQGQRLPLDRPALLQERLAQASPHLLVLLHGLCMNDTQWLRKGHDHGAFLAQALGATPVYVRYNTGLHTSTSGRDVARYLEGLAAHWPAPLESITLLGHSMGGLVARAACDEAGRTGMAWRSQLKHMVFLGTPHQGAALERAGHGLDVLLAATPFTAPFARLGQLRSAGITDLRHGYVRDADWAGRERFGSAAAPSANAAPQGASPSAAGGPGFEDHRDPLPLPEGVACFAVAATLAPRRGLLTERLHGDGLVSLRSALGQHDDPRRQLVFARDGQYIAYRTGHLELLSSPVVAQQLLRWLAPPKDRLED
ncbi:esterase/lipase family protein [Hydrogenophaga sp. BPS33]|uniref:esterase/lipase family protein n=1 Tax=Hydrogenophaga sp. BPS33 TaxID=2651974 RepID=UPI00131F942B|nr:alpha/beta hydrolase [Hydrogenophaga sp. BPS33]QHE84037.1 alpha/beta hydrolase [Hydrogenophaga sp. BPS33]